MTEDVLSKKGQIRGITLGKTGISEKTKKRWTNYRYQIGTEEQAFFYSCFKLFDDVVLGDMVDITYTEKENPESEYPFKNLKTMKKAAAGRNLLGSGSAKPSSEFKMSVDEKKLYNELVACNEKETLTEADVIYSLQENGCDAERANEIWLFLKQEQGL